MKRSLALVCAPLLVASLWGGAAAEQDDQAAMGEALVEHLGCLYCHGLGGKKGIDNPNAKRKYVPAWDEKKFIKRHPTPETVRQVIRDGRFPEKDKRAKGNPIPMPPWGNRLTESEMDAIIAYIWSLRETPPESHARGGRGNMEGPDTLSHRQEILEHERMLKSQPPVQPADDPTLPPDARLGKALVEHLGCLYCHGLGGREGINNPNARRKYVPSWDSEEFIRRYPIDDGVRYVIERGRFPEKDPAAKGSPIPMPPWGNRLSADELDAVIAYIWSLRETPVATHEKGGQGRD